MSDDIENWIMEITASIDAQREADQKCMAKVKSRLAKLEEVLRAKIESEEQGMSDCNKKCPKCGKNLQIKDVQCSVNLDYTRILYSCRTCKTESWGSQLKETKEERRKSDEC
jgi:hypothetical protein